MATVGTRADSGAADPSTNGPAPAPGPSKRSRWIAVGALGAAAALGVVVAMAVAGGDGDAATSAASQATRTARVVRQDLVEREKVDGTLGYSDARTVINRLSGTVTWTPSTGSVVRTNHRLFEVEGESVYLLDGSYPAYRTLRSGLKGDDVRQLERNLRVLGLDPDRDMKVDGTWDDGTTAAVKRWQERKGMEQDGSIEKGRVVFQPGSRRIGAIQLRAGDSASGGGGGGGGGGGTSPASSDRAAGSTTVFASQRVARVQSRGFSDIPKAHAAQDEQTTTPATTTTPTTTTTQPTTTAPPATTTTPPATTTPTTPTTPTPAPSTPERSQPSNGAQSTGAPSGRSSSGGSSGGAPSGGGGAGGATTGGSGDTAAGGDVTSELMTTTSTKRIVAVDLEATDQELASEGDEVEVELPGGDVVEGTIVRVGKVAEKKATSQDDDPPATIKVVIRLEKSTGTGLDQAPVDVQLERSRAKDVLTVPVTALLAQSGGKLAVEIRDGATRRVVPVTTGLYTDGYVEVSGDGLREGMTVTDSGV